MHIAKCKKSVCKCCFKYYYNYDNLKKAKTMKIVKRSLFARDCGGRKNGLPGQRGFFTAVKLSCIIL